MDRKIKIYLDTNMILDVFINHARAIRKGEDTNLPEKYIFMLANKENIEFITSFITKAEVVRELVSAHGAKYDYINQLWTDMLNALSCQYIAKFEFDESLVDIAARIPLKLRTMFNFMHLFITMKSGSYVVSGDKNFIAKIRNSLLYDKTLSYIELRKLMEGEN